MERFWSGLEEFVDDNVTADAHDAHLRYWGLQKIAVSFYLTGMKTSFHVPIAPGRKCAASACLLALLLLWAPMWAAALSANGLGCCNGAICAARGHSAANQGNVGGTTERSEQPMQCKHAQRGSAVTCDMSCCHQSTPTFLASIHFVLPSPNLLCQPQRAVPAACTLKIAEVFLSSEPASPPPRAIALSS